MKKILTLYMRDPDDRRYVTDQVTPSCEWVIAGEGVPTRKWDGTCTMLDHSGRWWARREVKPGKTPPPGFAPVSTDDVTGRTVGWEPIAQSGFARYHAEALVHATERRRVLTPGTYELLGPKINGNRDRRVSRHVLLAHGQHEVQHEAAPRDLLAYVATCGMEGIVWHHPDGRMCKLKVKDLRP